MFMYQVLRSGICNSIQMENKSMIIVKVTYTVQPAFVNKNQDNRNAFLKDFKKRDSNEFRYVVYFG